MDEAVGPLASTVKRLLRQPPPHQPPDYQPDPAMLSDFAATVNQARAQVYAHETACWTARRDVLLHLHSKGEPPFCTPPWMSAIRELGQVGSLAEHSSLRLPTFEAAIHAGIRHAEEAAARDDTARIAEMGRQVTAIGRKFCVPWWVAAEITD